MSYHYYRVSFSVTVVAWLTSIELINECSPTADRPLQDRQSSLIYVSHLFVCTRDDIYLRHFDCHRPREDTTVFVRDIEIPGG